MLCLSGFELYSRWVPRHFSLARSGLENLRNFRAPLVFKANFLYFWQPRASFTFLRNVWANYRLMAHFKPEKVSSLQSENVKYALTAPV